MAGDSEAVAVVCEDASQVAKIAAVRERLPALRHAVVIDPQGDTADAIALDELRARGRGATRPSSTARSAAVTPDDPFTFIYTSGTTGPPKGCVLTPRQLPRRGDDARGQRASSRRRSPTCSCRSRTRTRC